MEMECHSRIHGGGSAAPFLSQGPQQPGLTWVLEYCTLILFLVLGSYYSYLYLKSIYFFSRVYSKGRLRCFGFGGPRTMPCKASGGERCSASGGFKPQTPNPKTLKHENTEALKP